MKSVSEGKVKSTYVIFAVFFICMLVFNFMTPMVSDDFAHYYGADGTHINSLSSIFKNLSVLRNNTNGRVLAHFFVYLFQIPPRVVFRIINPVISTAVIYLLFRFFRSDDTVRNNVLLLTVIFMLWYFMPGFGQVFLWLTGSCNYSWGLALDLLLLYPFYAVYMGKDAFENRKHFGFKKIIYIVVAFAAGAWSENGATATVFVSAASVLIIWVRDKKPPKFLIVLLVAELTGFAFLMTAPAELGGRTADFSGDISFVDNLKYCISAMQKYCTWLLVVYASIFALSVPAGTDRKLLAFSLLLVIAGIISIAVFAFAAYLPQRSFYIMVSFTTLASVLLEKELWNTQMRNFAVVYTALITVLFLFSFVQGSGDILSLYMQSRSRETQISQAISDGEPSITLKAYAAGSMYPAVYNEELTEQPDGWYNKLLAGYYGFDSVYGTGINYYFD